MASPGRCPPPPGRTQGLAFPPSTQEPWQRVEGGHRGELRGEKEASEQTNPGPLEPLSAHFSGTPCPSLRAEQRSRRSITKPGSLREASESQQTSPSRGGGADVTAGALCPWEGPSPS